MKFCTADNDDNQKKSALINSKLKPLKTIFGNSKTINFFKNQSNII